MIGPELDQYSPLIGPQSGSLVSTFHQEMLNYHLSPSLEYQDRPYDTWFRAKKRKTFRSVARSVLLWMSLYLQMVRRRPVCTVSYSSETGTAKKLAKLAAELFNMSYRTRLRALDTRPDTEVTGEAADIELVVASTFGNGESPEMSRIYTKALDELVELYVNNDADARAKVLTAKSKVFNFSVFGLGSSAYPKFAAYGRHLDSCYAKLGAVRMLPFTAGDELKDQKGSFNKWLRKVFLVSLSIMKLEPPKAFLERINSVKQYRWKVAAKDRSKDSNTALAEFFDTPVSDFTLTKRTHLHHEASEPATLKLDFSFPAATTAPYCPGDHLTVFPANPRAKVEFLKTRLNNNPPGDRLVTLQVEAGGLWEAVEDLPAEVSFEDMLTFFLDISQTPAQSLLAVLAKFTEDREERELITVLANDDVVYEKWRQDGKVSSCHIVKTTK